MRHRSGHCFHQAAATDEHASHMAQRYSFVPVSLAKPHLQNHAPATWRDDTGTTEGRPGLLALEGAPNNPQERQFATPKAQQTASSSSSSGPIAGMTPNTTIAQKAKGSAMHGGHRIGEAISTDIMRLMNARPKPPPPHDACRPPPSMQATRSKHHQCSAH